MAGPWSIEVPTGWTVTGVSPSIALLPPDRSGVLQISFYTKDDRDIPIEDMQQMAAEGAARGAVPSAIRCGDFRGYTRDDERDNRCWRKWWLVAGSHHLFITWDCTITDRNTYRDLVNQIVSSLQLTERAT